MVRLATVGTSKITEKFISACKYTGRYSLYSAYSRTCEKAKAFKEKHGFANYCCDLTALAEDKNVDAVYIATPNLFHCEQSRLFLEHGKHVICEKPIVSEYKQYAELLALAEKNGVIYTEAIMSHHSNGRDVLFKGLSEIGRVSQARIDFCQLSSRYESYLKGEHVNIFDMSLHAGALMDLGVYCVYAAVELFGMPDSITSFASYLPNGADASGNTVFCYDGFNVSITYSKIGQSAVGSEIIGDKGTLKIGSVSQYADISLVKNGYEVKLYGFPDRTEVMSGECEKFADYIEHFAEYSEDYKNTSALTASVHKCMDLIKQSAGIKYF